MFGVSGRASFANEPRRGFAFILNQLLLGFFFVCLFLKPLKAALKTLERGRAAKEEQGMSLQGESEDGNITQGCQDVSGAARASRNHGILWVGWKIL